MVSQRLVRSHDSARASVFSAHRRLLRLLARSSVRVGKGCVSRSGTRPRRISNVAYSYSFATQPCRRGSDVVACDTRQRHSVRVDVWRPSFGVYLPRVLVSCLNVNAKPHQSATVTATTERDDATGHRLSGGVAGGKKSDALEISRERGTLRVSALGSCADPRKIRRGKINRSAN